MIAFVINVWNDQHLALRLVKQIREHFDQPALIIGDGVTIIPELNEITLARSFNRVKDQRTGYWTQRYLQIALQTSADVIIKLDPDAQIWRKFTPPQADWFGTLSNTKAFVRGGCCGFSRAAAEKVCRSGLLYKTYPYIYQRYGKYKWPHEEFSEEPLSSQDNIMRRVMAILDIQPTEWPEVLILGNDGIVPERGDYAATHPHPLL